MLDWSAPQSGWLIAGGAAHILGGFVVTLLFNVPLNNALAAVKPDSADGAALWARYCGVWTRWNLLRTVACLIAAASFIVALWLPGPGGA